MRWSKNADADQVRHDDELKIPCNLSVTLDRLAGFPKGDFGEAAQRSQIVAQRQIGADRPLHTFLAALILQFYFLKFAKGAICALLPFAIAQHPVNWAPFRHSLQPVPRSALCLSVPPESVRPTQKNRPKSHPRPSTRNGHPDGVVA